MRYVWMTALFVSAFVGCSKDDAAKGGPAASVAAPPPAVSAASAAPSATAKTAIALPRGRSPMPTLAEWNGDRKEVTVKGSTALGCETKMVREYLRVSCKGKNDSGGTPKAVSIVKGGHGEALIFAAEGVTSLIVPFIDGADVEVAFSWSDASHLLTLKWPHGSSRPVIIGVFEGAKSPLDGTASGDQNKLCGCFKKITHASTCDEMMGGADPDCDRTYGGDCESLLECSRGEPGKAPKCLPGFLNIIPSGRCERLCERGTDCPTGQVCAQDIAGAPVCISN